MGQTVQCRQLGKYKGWSIYEVAIVAHPAEAYDRSREEILSFCPAPMLPNTAAIDIITNSYKKSGMFSSLFKQLSVWGGAVLVGTGATQNDKKTTIVGGVLMFINGVLNIVQETRFDPTRYMSDFIPARVILSASEGHTYYGIGVK